MKSPVFIGGAQRSGTSLVRATLGSHPDLAIFEWDLTYWTRIYQSHSRYEAPQLKTELLTTLRDDPKVRAAEYQVDFDELDQLLEPDAGWAEIFEAFMTLYARERQRPYWGFKSPGSEVRADLILREFPTASFIHLIRDPRKVAVSYRNYGGGQWTYHPYRHIGVWKRSVALAERNERRYPDRYMTVRYEDLVDDRRNIVRQLCDFIGLPFDEQMLAMQDHPGWGGHNSSFSRPGQHHRAPEESLSALYELLLAPEMDRWDYQSATDRQRRPASWHRMRLRGAERMTEFAETLRLRTPRLWHASSAIRQLVRGAKRKAQRLLRDMSCS